MQRLRCFGGPAPSGRADVEVMAVGDHVVVAVRGHERHVQELGQRHRFLARLGIDDAAARQQERPLRLRQQGRGALDGLRVARDARLHRPIGSGAKRLSRDGLVVEEVAWNIEKGRSLLVRERGAERVVQHLGDALGLVHLERQLGDGLEQPDEIERLGAVTIDVVARDVAGDHDHRRAPLVSERDARDEVGGTGSGGRDAVGFPEARA